MRGDEKVENNTALPSVFVAAHELKAPLVLMRQLTFDLRDCQTDAERETALQRLEMTVERSLRLVEQLTKASRVNDLLFDTEPLQVASICQAVAAEMQPLAKSLGQTIRPRITRRSALIIGHRDMLTALLINLCDNALGHNPAGGMVVISAQQKKDHVSFMVRDNGPKMSAKVFERLRTELGRGPMPMGERARSSGLGLWIADQFTRAMSGNLTMIRHQKGGVTFSVTLPYSHQMTLL